MRKVYSGANVITRRRTYVRAIYEHDGEFFIKAGAAFSYLSNKIEFFGKFWVPVFCHNGWWFLSSKVVAFSGDHS